MRIFLLPISARHSLIYCQHISKPSSSHYSLFDRFVERVEAQARQTWVAWEKKPGGWKKKSTTIGNQLLKRIPYQEWGLKSIPPLSKKLRTNVVDGKVTDVEVLFPARFMTEEKVKETLERFALQGQLKHSDRMFWSYAGLPFAVPFALVPIIPNFPLFYLAFRAWSHWRAYNGSRHLELLLKKDAIIPSPSADLDKIYGADLIHQDGSSSGADQRLRTGRWKLKIETETKDIMILHPGMGELIGEHFRIPEMASLIERAIERLEKDIRGGKVDTTYSRYSSSTRKPRTKIGLLIKWIMLGIPVAIVFYIASLAFRNTVGLRLHEWQEARKPRRPPQYEPLVPREIRVLVVKPGKDDEKIFCDLRHVELADNPQFEALSYVWGDSLRQREIICGDSEVDIGINLHEALEGLRLPDQERVVWADALCINQADIKERTHQVQQIGEVYSTAQRVLIWLGKETDANRGAFKMIRAICAEYPNQMARWVDEARELGYLSNVEDWEDWDADFHSFFEKTFVEQPTIDREMPESSTPLISGKIRTEPIAELLRHSWFRRIWVTQELASARSAVVMCGKSELSWNVFKGVVDFLWPIIPHQYAKETYELGPPPADTLIARTNLLTMHLMRSKHQSKTSGHTLLDLVLLTRGFECSDPRDKVFALVGMAKDVESTDWEVRPDYSRPIEDVYKQFALWSITKRHDLQVLALTPDPLMPPTLSLPSWVPDLARPNKADPLPVMPNLPSAASEASWTEGLTARLKQRDVFHADSSAFVSTVRGVSSTRKWPRVSLEDNNSELRVHGRQVDKISDVGSVANFAMVPYYNSNSSGRPDSAGSSYTRIHDWLRETLMITTQGTGDLPFEVFRIWWPTLSCGLDASGKPLKRKWLYAFTVASTQLGFRIPDYGWRNYVPLDGFLEFKDPAWATSRLRNYHEPAIIRWAQFRRFCCTADGRLGLVPGGAAPGDIICVLDGGRVPYVLRPSTDGGSYKVIGEAYIHNLMHGEAMKLDGKKIREGSFALH